MRFEDGANTRRIGTSRFDLKAQGTHQSLRPVLKEA
jgi:hypothetical protein